MAGLTKIRWDPILAQSYTKSFRSECVRALKQIAEPICALYEYPDLILINICDFKSNQNIIGKDYKYIIGVALQDESVIYIDKAAVKNREKATKLIDKYLLETVLVHELAHLFIPDNIMHSLTWARSVVHIWDVIHEGMAISKKDLRALILLDLKPNMSKIKYSKMKSELPKRG